MLPNFFLAGGPEVRDDGALHVALFTHARHGWLRCESTSLYLYDPQALRRIRAAVPDARLIVLVSRSGRPAALELDPPVLRRVGARAGLPPRL